MSRPDSLPPAPPSTPAPTPSPSQDKRLKVKLTHKPFWQTRTLRYSVIISSALASVLLFLLASASSNTPFLDRYYPTLLLLNGLIALAMLLLVSTLIWRLVKRHRAGQFGTRLMARFALAFALMGVIPGGLIYLVSVQFLSRSIETWFDLRVDKALEAGLALGRTTLDGMLSDLNTKARNLANQLSDVPETQQANVLSRLSEQNGIRQTLLFYGSGKVLASAVDLVSPDRTTTGVGRLSFGLSNLHPDLPPPNVMQQLRLQHSYAAIEGSEPESSLQNPGSGGATHSSLQLRVVVPVPRTSLDFNTDALYLQLIQPVPQALTDNAEEVQNGARDYQELSLSRTGLQKIYTVTLTLALLLSIFAALAAAFLLATWLTAPLLQLAEGTRAVASGDYRPMQESHEKDELGSLTLSFNTMTRQLDEARKTVEHNRIQLENAKTYLESILSNMSAGVLVLDEALHIITANQAAGRILEVSFSDYLGHRLTEIPGLSELDQAIERAFSEQTGIGNDADPVAYQDWQKQIELVRGSRDVTASQESSPLSEQDSEPLTLLARGSRCPVGGGDGIGKGQDDPVQQGYLVVFDDVSDVISAQRSVAWSEVARRLAHEIKNPLTPIQLSAERLQMKLKDHLTEGDAKVLERGVTTIVNQVNAMKHMVDDFRDYAKTPTTPLTPIDLNALVTEIMTLYGAEAANTPIDLKLAEDLPMIVGNATRLRQVIHNLVQNAQDATHEQAQPRIEILTERVGSAIRINSNVLRNPRVAMVRLTVNDNGSGFPAKILNRVFEPYVTTKSRGTGLGLAVVKKIAEEHEARIEVRNRTEGGASVTLLFTRLAEDATLIQEVGAAASG